MKFCGSCDQPIREGQTFTTHDIASPTGAGWTVYRHVYRCTPVPIQTRQTSPRY